jgi:RNA-directed DNA polymerase
MWLGIDRATLATLTDPRPHREQRAAHYRYAWIAKPLGGHRLVEAPKVRLRTVQRDILDGILAHIPPHEAAHGFRAGRSVIGFAAQHVQREVVVRVDLQAFFSSVIRARVAGLFRTAGYPRAVAHTLATLCTHRTPRDVLRQAPGTARDELSASPDRQAPATPGDLRAASPDRQAPGTLFSGPFADDLARLSRPHLPQGAPTSGALANLAAYRLDVRVTALAAAIGARYSRYADDLVISGDRSLVRAAPSLIARLGAIAIDEGFALNFKKTRVMTAAGRQRITGLVVNDKLSVPRAEVDRLRAILHNCVRSGPASQNRDAHADFRAHLRGRVEWVAAVDPKKGERLRATFDQIRWDATSSPAETY